MKWLSTIGEGLASIFGFSDPPKPRRIKRPRTIAAALQADYECVQKDWEKVARDLGGKR